MAREDNRAPLLTRRAAVHLAHLGWRTISALGHDHVMFASDYPFESVDEAAHFIDGVAIDEHVRDDICFNNAAKLLSLPRTS